MAHPVADRSLVGDGAAEQVLRVLAEGGWLEMQELSRRCLILAPSLSRIVPSLEGRGLVQRRAVSTDQRRMSVSLAPAGRRLFDAVAAGSEPLYAEIGAQLGARTVEDLLRALDALIAKLDEEGVSRL